MYFMLFFFFLSTFFYSDESQFFYSDESQLKHLIRCAVYKFAYDFVQLYDAILKNVFADSRASWVFV